MRSIVLVATLLLPVAALAQQAPPWKPPAAAQPPGQAAAPTAQPSAQPTAGQPDPSDLDLTQAWLGYKAMQQRIEKPFLDRAQQVLDDKIRAEQRANELERRLAQVEAICGQPCKAAAQEPQPGAPGQASAPQPSPASGQASAPASQPNPALDAR